MNITPQEALRLSRADALLRQHGRGMNCANQYDLDGLGVDEAVFNAAEVANLIDEAVAAKDKTIAALRQEIRDADREARDAFHEGRAEEAERHRNEQNW